ncbi:MAG TPA: transglycosylase domain-containing protein, partial [Thermoleophilaceae bacterium]|nr:transglycosylase domain-containing protein [Thermoleophilaceae bacterium]
STRAPARPPKPSPEALTGMPESPTSIPTTQPGRRGGRFDRSNGSGPPPAAPDPPKPRLKKLRLALLLLGLSVLALISTVFGMLMAVASDLPALENKAEYQAAENSVLYAAVGDCKLSDTDGCEEIARLTGNQNRILLTESQISPNIKNAVIAVEDKRFYEHEGVDYQGIARALWQDIRRQEAAQGGSTITQQFVKNALSAQGNRSVFQKLREAALAYHLERKWTKDKVLTQYLNTVYFGNGAYGVESAVRTYFGTPTLQPDGTTAEVYDADDPEAADVTPAEAALLAGLIASPTLYDPVENRRQATQRRNLVLARMLEQRKISRAQYEDGIRTALPDDAQIDPPAVDSDEPFFSTWLTEQLVDRYRPGVVFGGGLKIKTTIDTELQAAAEQAIAGRLGAIGPAASLVAIENKSGKIKAMVGGADYRQNGFNLATNGHRQPGSAFKPFTLVRSLADGVSPESTFVSEPRTFDLASGPFEVSNYEDAYYGIESLRTATATSDNSVFAQLGLQTGTRRIARLARRMGIRTPISTNPAMTLGGLQEGLTPLEMAYAYTTIANKGLRKSGTLAPGEDGPVGVEWVKGDGVEHENELREKRVFSPEVGELAHQLLAGVVSGGTGKAAQIGEFAAGKTGTTENYGDAWFVGFNEELTVAVWVGYPDRLTPMETEYHGQPVAGGTFPAEIWHDLMLAWIAIRDQRLIDRGKDPDADGTSTAPLAPVPSTTGPAPEEGTETEGGPGDGAGQTGDDSAPSAPDETPPGAPEATPPTPAEPQPPAPAPGGDGGAGGGAVAP